jgi:hypothetical protein
VRFLAHEANLVGHAGCELGIRVLFELTVRELNRAVFLGKKGKQESEARLPKEPLLRHLAVLVHGLPHDREILHQVGQERVILVVPVRKDKELQHLDVLLSTVRSLEQFVQAWVHCVGELDEDVVDWLGLVSFGFPGFKVGFEYGFVVKGHRAEASALEVKIEVHVVLLLVDLSSGL